MLVFAYPLLFTLLPLPWLLRVVLPARRVNQSSVLVPFGDRIEAAKQSHREESPVSSRRRFVVPIVLWLLALVAIARPQWIEPPLSKQIPTRDLLLLVDLSGSMQQEDFTDAEGEQIDRLSAVKEVVGEFVEKRDGDRVGLVVFGDAPFLQAPFSIDLDLSRKLLDQCDVGMAGPRTALGDAIGLGINLFEKSETSTKTIIALTDGNDTKSQLPPLEAARVAADRNITIHTVAIGDPSTVGEDELDEEALRDVALTTNGKYFFAADRSDLKSIYDQLDRIETHEVNTVSHRPRRDIYFIPLIVALLISIGERFSTARRMNVSADRSDPGRSIHVDPITGKLELKG